MANQAFLLLVLPIGLSIYYLALPEPRGKLWFLFLLSFSLYALAGWQFLLLLAGLSLATFWLARWKRPGWGIALNLLSLAIFKYWNFGVGNVNALAERLGTSLFLPLLTIGLPLGISFYIFKHIGYLIETRNGRYPPSRDFLSFATYSAFFPQIIAGPISDYNQTASQFASLPARLTTSQAYRGFLMISMGLVKKILIADNLATAAGLQTINSVSGIGPAWYLVIAYACQLYFDFSGYTDIVLGIACLFGIELPANFNNPYTAAHIGQFWERWHISLSTWFRYYLFSPLSRSLLRASKGRGKELAQFLATLATMTLVGFWHGAAWTFVLWGLYHGLLLSWNTWLQRRMDIRLPVGLQRTGFLLSLLFGWALFMSPEAGSLGHLLGQMIGINGLGSPADLLGLIANPATVPLLFGIFMAFSGFAEGADLLKLSPTGKRWMAFAWGTLAAISLLWMGTRVQFLYMQF